MKKRADKKKEADVLRKELAGGESLRPNPPLLGDGLHREAVWLDLCYPRIC